MHRLQRSGSTDWRRYFVYRHECVRTTWKFRAVVLAALVLLATVTRPVWARTLASALTCDGSWQSADAILIENLEPEYLLFEHVALLRRRGLTGRVFVPTQASPDPERPALLAGEFVAVMARVAHMPPPEIIPVREVEPFSLNVALQVRDFLHRERVQSVIVVSPGFRSRRASLVYRKIFKDAGIATFCVPVFGSETPENWSDSWHGRQRVGLELVKLLYYRAYVLPFLLRT
jgi:hypothetical protein